MTAAPSSIASYASALYWFVQTYAPARGMKIDNAEQVLFLTGPTPTFVLSADGGAYTGHYAQVISDGNGFDSSIEFGPQSWASTFTIDANGRLQVGDEYADTYPNMPASLIYFNTPGLSILSGVISTTCSILPGNVLSCVDLGQDQFQTCPNSEEVGSWVVLGSVIGGACTAFSFLASCLEDP
ncbi:hypothetical protein MMC18_001206 [Xylographa bjoerkii]|nr:hypothetical protein [Xylographa bjoerkii]